MSKRSDRNDPAPASAPAESVTSTLLAALLPIMAAVFVAFLVTGLALPVLPLHVHDGLGLSAFVVGLVAGAQFTAALLSRFGAGHTADSRGGKHAVLAGLVIAAVAGLFYLLSLRFTAVPVTSVTILLLGRALLGAAESFIITGALGWGLALGGPGNAGKVMAWMGTAMYVAFAVGAPAGTAFYAAYGFAAIALATTLLPLATLLLVAPLQPVSLPAPKRPAFRQVLDAVYLPGLGLGLCSIGFGAITTFSALLFAQRGWSHGWLALTAFATAFVVARMLFSHAADRFGGARVALASVVTEAAGLALIWAAPGSAWALFGAVVTGFGYSLVYPGFGVEAVRSAPPESRSLAMGAYTAFLDLALGLANPGLGLVAGRAGLRPVFLVSASAVICSAVVAMQLLVRSRSTDTASGESQAVIARERLVSQEGN